MQVLPDTSATFEVIHRYRSREASSTRLADGAGEAHVHLVRLGPGGAIDRHRAGFGQLWIIVEGSGWVAGEDGERHDLDVGQVACIARGEHHAKGTDTGLLAVMVQVHDLMPITDTV